MSVKTLVDRGLEIVSEMKLLKKELDAIEEKLGRAALDGEHQELKDPDREGRRFLAHGSKRILPITFTADKIVQSFKQSSTLHHNLRQLVGENASNGRLRQFYAPVTTYEICFDDGKQFRAAAGELLGKDIGPKFITACVAVDKHGIAKNDTKIEWNKTEEIVEVRRG